MRDRRNLILITSPIADGKEKNAFYCHYSPQSFTCSRNVAPLGCDGGDGAPVHDRHQRQQEERI